MTKKYNAIVVSLFGGPGSGKSILAAKIFAALKEKFIACEMGREYIKDKLYEGSKTAVQNQIYIFGKQQYILFRLSDRVDVIVTDSPLPFSVLYDQTNSEVLRAIVFDEFNKYNNLNFFLDRNESIEYETKGRYQDLESAKQVDEKLLGILKDNNVKYDNISGISDDTVNLVVDKVLKELQKNEQQGAVE